MNDIYKRIICPDFVVDNEYMFFPVYKSDEFVRVDTNTGEVKVLCTFETDSQKDYYNLYNSMVKVGKYIVLAPANAEKIAIYDIEDEKMHYIELEEAEANGNEIYDATSLFYGCLRDGDYVFLLGFYYPAIVRIDMRNFEVYYIREWVKQLDSNIPRGDKRGYIGNGCCIQGRRAIFPIMCAPALLYLDLDSLSSHIEIVDTQMDGFGVMVCDEENLFLQGKGDSIGKVCKFSLDKKRVIVDALQIESLNRVDYGTAFSGTVKDGNTWFLFPQEGTNLYELNTESMMAEIPSWCSFLDKHKYGKDQWVLCAKQIEKRIVFTTNDDKMWHEYDLNTGKVSHYAVLLPEEYVEKRMQEKMKRIIVKRKIISESEYNLESFMKIL